ncbi:MAG TPA: bifunctional adenosylcobinamide kinase/adenosylcobinamide-phosphate guanylyltransferase [Micromonosporaceae bacterium]
MSTPTSAQAPTRRRALVLGGIRSGKSEFAERLAHAAAADEPVHYLATARRDAADPRWEARIEAHRLRRPAHWRTTDLGTDPVRLPELIRAAAPTQTLLVDDVATWIAGLLMPAGFDTLGTTPLPDLTRYVDQLGAAVRVTPARLVLVSAEVGLSLVPLSEAGRAYVDVLGATNQALAAACDTVALVIAGNAVPVKGGL